MKLNSPFIITSRLLAGLRVPAHGSLSEISIEAIGSTSDGRTRYRYFIDTPEFNHSGQNLKSGCGGGSLQEGMESLLSFLGAAGEAYGYQMRTKRESDNSDLFPVNVMAWAYQNSDELSMLQCELEENKELITP